MKSNEVSYVIQSENGLFFRSYKQGRFPDSFVPELNKAMLYAQEGTANGVKTRMMRENPSAKLSVIPVALRLQPIN